MVSHAASWYEAAGALATDPAVQTNDERDTSREDGAKMRETVNAVVAEYDKIGAGEMAQQCLDASRIVQIAESKTGWKEIVFLIAALASFTVALFITKVRLFRHRCGSFHAASWAVSPLFMVIGSLLEGHGICMLEQNSMTRLIIVSMLRNP